MAIKVQASRFAVLRVEDDDDDSDEKDAKSKQPSSKNKQQPNELKKKARKKKKAEQIKNETEELRNLAFIKSSKKSGSGSSTKISAATESQWEEWEQRDDEDVEREFEKELSNALLQSRLEYEEKEKAGAANDDGGEKKNGEGKKNKKKNKPPAISPETVGISNKKLLEMPKEMGCPEVGQNATEKTSKQNKVQEESHKKTPIKDYKAAIFQKEQEVKDLREINKKIEAEVAEVKKKNQQFYLMLGRGEMMDKSAIKAELEELQQFRDNLTLEVSQCSSELEKERSRSHALKAERDKLKMIKHGGK